MAKKSKKKGKKVRYYTPQTITETKGGVTTIIKFNPPGP